MYYRSRYRPKRKLRVNKKLVIVIAAAVMILVLTVLYGNHLKAKLAALAESTAPMPEEVTVAPDALAVTGAAPVLTACPLELAGLDADSAAEKADELATASYTGVSICLTDENGRPLYRSSVASLIAPGAEGSGESLCDLSEVTAALHAEGLRAVGCFEVRSLDGDATAAEALRSYEIALICELSGLGIDEVLLFGLEVPTQENAAPLEYIEKIKQGAPSLIVGATFDLDSLKTGDTEFEMLISRADYLAVTLTLPADDSITVGDWISHQISGAVAIFTRYAPRVVMPYVSDAVTQEEVAAVNESRVNSWQIYAAAGQTLPSQGGNP